MIKFINLKQERPYILFKKHYEKALEANQNNIESISIASYNPITDEVDARYVNIKMIKENNFIFFTNYNSSKSIAFKNHNQISALIYWPSINIQIRMKAKIKKTEIKFNNKFFRERDIKKNALAISSEQSKQIKSYEMVQSKYMKILKGADLKKCPNYWGGFKFSPYYFEFWKGHESRVNKREVFNNIDGIWKHSFLQP